MIKKKEKKKEHTDMSTYFNSSPGSNKDQIFFI